MSHPSAGKSWAEIHAATRAQWMQCAQVIAQATSPITSTGVARALGKYRSYVSYTLNQMCRARLLDFQQLFDVGNAKSWRLTDEGYAMLEHGIDGNTAITLPPNAISRHDPRRLMDAMGVPRTPPPAPAAARTHVLR